MSKTVRYTDLSKSVRRTVENKINKIVKAHSFLVFRRCATHYIETRRSEKRLNKEIAQKEAELDALKKSKP